MAAINSLEKNLEKKTNKKKEKKERSANDKITV